MNLFRKLYEHFYVLILTQYLHLEYTQNDRESRPKKLLKPKVINRKK